MTAAAAQDADLIIENRPFDAIAAGESASFSHIVTQPDIDRFAVVVPGVRAGHPD